MDKTKKALVKGVLSGDAIILSGKVPKNSLTSIPEENTLFLTGIISPKVGNSNKLEEEPYGFESKEFLRKLLIGKVITYKLDYKSNDRLFGQVFLPDEKENVAQIIIKNGYAKIGYVPKANENIYKTDYWTNLKENEEKAKKENLNLWSNDEPSKHKRKLHNITDDSFDIENIKKDIKNKEILDVIIDYVFNCSFYSVYIPKYQLYAKLNLRFIAIPNVNKDEGLYKTGKAYAERMAQNHDAKMTLIAIDEKKNLIGDLNLTSNNQSVAGLILKEGYSKVFINNNIPYSKEDLNSMKNYQNEAKEKRLRIWKDEPVNDPKKSKKNDEDNELGNVKCMFVHSGDSISIQKKPGEEFIRIFLSNLKAPSFAKPNTNENDQPWAFQAKEFLRKKLVGKILKCDYDFTRVPKENPENINSIKSNTNKKMKFYTIYYKDDNDIEKCINVELIEKGFANLITYKLEEGDPSKEIDNMREAEEYAKSKKIGIFSPKIPPFANFSDLLTANKTKKKEFVSFLVGFSNLPCIVEYCFSGFRLKLRIDNKQCSIPFSLLGIKTFQKDKNNTDLIEKYYKKSLDYVNDKILQRDAICDIIQADKIGNYFGYLYFNKKNFAYDLLSQGLAVVNETNYNNKNIYEDEMLKNEKIAKEKKLGIWEDEGLANMLKFGGESYSVKSNKKYEEINKNIKIRVTEQIDMNNFYVNVQPNKILDTISNTLSLYDSGKKKGIPLETPIKNGTLCAALYPDDGKYYRGLIKSQNKKEEKYTVEFIDYGNIETLTIDDLIKLDGSISSYEPQSLFCELAYLKYSQNSMNKSVKKYPDFIDLDVILEAKLVYSYNKDGQLKNGLVIYQKNKDLESSYHAELLKIGYVKLDKSRKLPDYLKDLEKYENEANKNNLGLWAENEELDYDKEDEDDY